MEPFLKYISKKKRKRSAIYGHQPTAMTSDYVPFRTQVSEENGLKHDGPKNRQSVHQIVLPDDDDSSSIGENFEVASITSSIEDQLTWRGRMQVALHSLPFQVFILSLVVLDALIVLFELLLDVGAFNNIECRGEFILEQASYCHYQEETRNNCGPSPDLILEETNLTEGNGSTFCRCVYRLGKTICAEHTESKGVNAGLVLHIMSICILTTFLIEIVLKLIAFRLKYFTHKFEVFDGIIVVISWILDIASISREESFAQVATLIIILRLWRVVRIVNGAILSSKARADDQLHKARQSARTVIHALHKAQEKLTNEQKAYEQLKDILEEKGFDIPEKPNSDIIPSYPYDEEEGVKFD